MRGASGDLCFWLGFHVAELAFYCATCILVTVFVIVIGIALFKAMRAVW